MSIRRLLYKKKKKKKKAQICFVLFGLSATLLCSRYRNKSINCVVSDILLRQRAATVLAKAGKVV